MKTIRGALIGIVLVAAIAGTWWWQHAGRIQAIATASLPATPDLELVPLLLRDQVALAEAEARSRFDARSGLGKLSRLYHANGFLNEALHCYVGLEQLEPASARWFHFHATVLAGYGEIEPALLLWRRVVSLAPDFLPAQLRLGDCEFKSNRPAEAAATYRAVLKQDPGNSYALLGLARIDCEAKQWDQAQERLERVVAQTNYTLGYDLIVTLYEQTGQTERAVALRAAHKASGAFRGVPDPWLDELMDACFDSYRLALSAGFIARNGDPGQAIRLLERAIELAPNDVSARFQLGMLGLAQGNFNLAREQLERCTRLAPDFADGWAQLSALQSQRGENSAAAQTLATGLAHCPESPGLHLMRARNFQKAGLNRQALGEYRESIRLRPNEAAAYLELANFQIKLGQVEDAIPLLMQSLEAEPENPMALSILTYHAISTGDESAAARWLAKVRHQPRVPAQQVVKLNAAFQAQFNRGTR